MYLVFTRTTGESYRRRLRSLLLYLCDVSRALIKSFVWLILFFRCLCFVMSVVQFCLSFFVLNVVFQYLEGVLCLMYKYGIIRNTHISVFFFLQFPWFASHNMSSASWFRMMCKLWFHICELTFHFWEMKWDLCSSVSFESKKSQWTWFLNQMQVILIYVMWSLSLLCFDRRTCVGARI